MFPNCFKFVLRFIQIKLNFHFMFAHVPMFHSGSQVARYSSGITGNFQSVLENWPQKFSRSDCPTRDIVRVAYPRARCPVRPARPASQAGKTGEESPALISLPGRPGFGGVQAKILTCWHKRSESWNIDMYCCKTLKIINKLMNFFLNNTLIFLNTAPTPKKIFLMTCRKHVAKVIKQLTCCSNITLAN